MSGHGQAACLWGMGLHLLRRDRESMAERGCGEPRFQEKGAPALACSTSDQVSLARALGFARATEQMCLYSLRSKNVLCICPES